MFLHTKKKEQKCSPIHSNYMCAGSMVSDKLDFIANTSLKKEKPQKKS